MAKLERMPLSCRTLVFSFPQHRNTATPQIRTSDSGIYFATEKDFFFEGSDVDTTACIIHSGTCDTISVGKPGSGSAIEGSLY